MSVSYVASSSSFSSFSGIDQTETRLVEIDEEMVEASADYAKIKALNEEKEELEATYDTDITRWSELEELKEQ
jgi:ATP-binding cassette subfamily F protein uup